MRINRNTLDKMVIDFIQQEKKEYKLKSRGGIFYKKEGDYFVTILAGIAGMKADRVRVGGYVKPYVIDDIFWDVFHMPGNSKEPMGLRANGAFTVDPLMVFSSTMNYGEVEKIGTIASELLRQCHEEVMHVIEAINDFNDFLLLARDKGDMSLFNYDLTHMLLLINDKRYQEARMIAEELLLRGEHGRFQNEGKYINEHILDYCNVQLEV